MDTLLIHAQVPTYGLAANFFLVLVATFSSSQMKFTLGCWTVASAQRLNLGTWSRRLGSLALSRPYSGLLKEVMRRRNEPVRT